MLREIMASVTMGLALFSASVRLPAATCILSNTSSPKACQMGCCANKACCKTAQERTGLPVQPLAKADAAQQNISAIPATIAMTLVPFVATTRLPVFSSANGMARSPSPLALICIRLI